MLNERRRNPDFDARALGVADAPEHSGRAKVQDNVPVPPALPVRGVVPAGVDGIEETIRRAFEGVWNEQKDDAPPVLDQDTVLLNTGLDSLGFAVLITRLEEDLGYDPFSLSDEPFYPQTFGELVRFYEAHAPVS